MNSTDMPLKAKYLILFVHVTKASDEALLKLVFKGKYYIFH